MRGGGATAASPPARDDGGGVGVGAGLAASRSGHW